MAARSARSGVATAAALLAASFACSATPPSVSTTGRQSPAVNQSGDHAVTTVLYGAQPERVGKKIAIRSAFLIPVQGFDQTRCGADPHCGDFYESAMLYIEVQSIWPEPVLLTAARLEKLGIRSRQMDPGAMGEAVLAEQITRQRSPQSFLFQPGDIKLIHLGSGVRLDGLMEFFTEELRHELISCDGGRCMLHNLRRVKELNEFLAQHYGKQASLRLTIYEKDYQPILTTSFRLADGDDLFSVGDVRKSAYRLQHDRFIAEALYLLQGGKESFKYRQEPKRRNRVRPNIDMNVDADTN